MNELLRGNLTSIVLFIASIFSAYLFAVGVINLTTVIFIVIGSLIVIIIASFQSKIKKTQEDVEGQSNEVKRLNEKLKIYEQLVDLKARIISLEKGRKNAKD